MSAKYTHDCTSCTFIGNRKLYIYICNKTAPQLVSVLLRYGNEGREYFSNEFVRPLTVVKGKQFAEWIARRCQVSYAEAWGLVEQIAGLTK